MSRQELADISTSGIDPSNPCCRTCANVDLIGCLRAYPEHLNHQHTSQASDGPKISIVVLTHNDINNVNDSISKILSILDDELFEELIILDNASSDGTRKFLDSIQYTKKLRLIFSDSNLGVAGGRFRLFKEAKGDIIASLDSDVQVNGKDYFKRAKELLYANDTIAICGASGYLAHISNGDLNLRPSNKNQNVDCVSGFCHIFRRKLLNEIQISQEFFPFWCEDTDFCFQAIEKGYKIRQLNGGPGLIHTYKSIATRSNDPLKIKHERLLARKWNGRIRLKGSFRASLARFCRHSPASMIMSLRMLINKQASIIYRYFAD